MANLCVGRDGHDGINPGSYGAKGPTLTTFSPSKWTAGMGASGRGATEVLVKISGGGRDVDGVQAHMEYIDRHGKLELETDYGETLQGKRAATEVINDWALDYGRVPGEPHTREKGGQAEGRKPPRQAFNIVLSMPTGTSPHKVLKAARSFAREEFAHQHRYVMALHTEQKDGHGKHPHVHLVVKTEHEFDGRRLNPRKADLQRWREQFAQHLVELGVPATATRRDDRGKVKLSKKTPIYRASNRPASSTRFGHSRVLETAAGDSTFMRRKLEAVRRDLKEQGGVTDRESYQALLNVRARVDARYADAIQWLNAQGRHAEAQRFELMHRHLPAVRSERQALADHILKSDMSPGRSSEHSERLR